MPLFGDLSYASKTLKPIGRPVDDLKELYAKKGEDYTYVVDSLNTAKTALNNIPHQDKDKAIVDAAKKKYQDTFNQYEEEGDFENRIIDTKNLATAMANDYGLKEVQANALGRSAMITDLKERVAKGEITSKDMNDAIKTSDWGYKGVQKDEETGQFSGNYTPINVQNRTYASKEVMGVLDGWKASTIVLKDEQGRELTPMDNGKAGYLKGETVEYVSEAELQAAAIRHVKSDPNIQSQFEQDTYMEMENLLHDREGNRRDLNTDDIRNLMLRGGVSEKLANALGIKTAKDLTNLDEVLEGKGLEEVYRMVKEEQLTNDAIALGVSKESYEKHIQSIKKDWLQEAGMKRLANPPAEALLTTYATSDKIGLEELEKAGKAYTTSITSLESNEAELKAELAKKDDKDPTTLSNPVRVKELTESISANKQNIANVENRGNALISGNKEINALIQDTIQGGKFIQDVDSAWRYVTPENQINYKIDGLNINTTSMQRLIWKNVAEELSDEEVQKFIDLDINPYIAQATAQLEKQFSDRAGAPIKIDAEKFSSEITALGTKLHKEAIANETGKLRNRIEYSSNLLKEKAENGEIKTTDEYKTWTLSKASAKDNIANPIFQLNDKVANLPGKTAGWKDAFTSVNGINLSTFIEEEFGSDDEDGDIHWDDAQMQSTIDVRPDKDGVYRPVVLLTVPIKDTESEVANATKLVDIPVHNESAGYEQLYTEALVSERERLVAKGQQSPLSGTDQDMLDRINLNMYNLSKYAQNVDDAGLYDGVEGDKEITWWDGQVATVSVYNGNSPGNFGYLLTTGKGDSKEFYGSKDGGKSITRHSYKEISDPYSGITPLGANSVTDLKVLFGNMAYKYRNEINKPKTEATDDHSGNPYTPTIGQTRDQLIETYFTGVLPKYGVTETLLKDSSGKEDYVTKLLELTEEQQNLIGVTIVDNVEDGSVEVTGARKNNK